MKHNRSRVTAARARDARSCPGSVIEKAGSLRGIVMTGAAIRCESKLQRLKGKENRIMTGEKLMVSSSLEEVIDRILDKEIVVDDGHVFHWLVVSSLP
jgi:hypothetical protein